MGISALLTPIPRKSTVGVCMELRTGVAAATSSNILVPSTHSIGELPSQVPGRAVHMSWLVVFRHYGLRHSACLPTTVFWVRISSASAILYLRSRPHMLITLQFRTYKKASRCVRAYLSRLHQSAEWWLSLSEVARCDSIQGFKLHGCPLPYDRPAARLVSLCVKVSDRPPSRHAHFSQCH